MYVFNETWAEDLARGMERMNPTVDWQAAFASSGMPPPPRNLVISAIALGVECDCMEFAAWCNTTGDHIIVVSLLPSAAQAGKNIKAFLVEASLRSLHRATLPITDEADTLSPWHPVCSQDMSAAVAVATKDKFSWRSGKMYSSLSMRL